MFTRKWNLIFILFILSDPAIYNTYSFILVLVTYHKYNLESKVMDPPFLTSCDYRISCSKLLLFSDLVDQIPGVPTPAPTVPGACGANQLTCQNKNCYSQSQKCNFRDDCGDNSDEAKCGTCFGGKGLCIIHVLVVRYR